MKSIIQFVAICVPCFLFGQDYIGYYNQINQARKFVLQQDYEEAVSLYRTTFEKFDFEFARDCVHAAEVAVLIQEKEAVKYFIACALRRGVPMSYFLDDEKYDVFKASKHWNTLLTISDSLSQIYSTAIHQELRAEINKMFQADQAIRKTYYKWYNFLWRPIISKKWKQLNLKQVERIVEITEEVGFPGEQFIGIDSPKDHPKISSNQLSAGMPIVILIHHYSQPNSSYDSLFFEQVLKGNLYHEHFATICDFESKFGKEKYENYGFYGIRFQLDSNKDLDKKRSRIGLLESQAIEKLNQQNILTKFWNQLY